MEKVATELVEGRKLHRYFGVELNNESWDLIEQIDESRPARCSATGVEPGLQPVEETVEAEDEGLGVQAS